MFKIFNTISKIFDFFFYAPGANLRYFLCLKISDKQKWTKIKFLTNCNLRTVSLAFVTVGFVVWSTNWFIVFGTRALSVARASMYYWHTTVNRKFIYRYSIQKRTFVLYGPVMFYCKLWVKYRQSTQRHALV